jgi:tRNA(Arg) A34 adenosine deaminase TadA
MRGGRKGRPSKQPASGSRKAERASRKAGRAADARWLAEAAALAVAGMRAGRGGPFGAVVVREGEVLGRGCNRVLESGDPTAHAEVTAIREACRALGGFSLAGCTLYTSCEPCPMCLGAAYWARVDRIVYANTRRDAAAIGFSDDFIYRELARPLARRKLPIRRLASPEARDAFREWRDKADKTPY